MKIKESIHAITANLNGTKTQISKIISIQLAFQHFNIGNY